MKKEMGEPKPWSEDRIFQTTYFCNVCREDDKVTRWIRAYYTPHVDHELFEFNLAFSRFINWPPTLERLGWYGRWGGAQAGLMFSVLDGMNGKVWGDAYIVSTCGRAMPKAQYLVEMVVPALHKALSDSSELRQYLRRTPSLEGTYERLKRIFGVQSFMAGQIIADLKNTSGHPLMEANDWYDWAAPGPGSQRGMSWVFNGNSREKYRSEEFIANLNHIRELMTFPLLETICNQDLQNCLCEFDKYMRIYTNTGRSKRGYPGA